MAELAVRTGRNDRSAVQAERSTARSNPMDLRFWFWIAYAVCARPVYGVATVQPENKKSDQLDLGFLRTPQDDSGHETWVPLIKKINSLQIQYFDPQLNSWIDRWTNAARLPWLVKITVGRTDAAEPWEAIIPLRRTPF